MRKIYVDSNIFVDAEIEGREHHQDAIRFFNLLFARNDIRICTSVYTLLEIASAVTRQIGDNGNVYQYLYNVEVKYREGQVLWIYPSRRGESVRSFNFEQFVRALIEVAVNYHTPAGDTIHAHALKTNRIRTLITRNGEHFQGLERKEILTPEEFLARLPNR